MSAPNAAPETASLTIDGVTVSRDRIDWAGRQLRQYQRKLDKLEVKIAERPEIIHQSSPPSDGMPRSSSVGNPTLARVIMMDSLDGDIKHLKAYFIAVERVRARLTERQRIITDNLYFKPVLERSTMGDVRTLLHIGKSEYYRTQDEALFEFALVLPEDPNDSETAGMGQTGDK